MITDQDVADLYRCLLNRAPETPDTIAAFRAYYPGFDQGRLAVLGSGEFSSLLDRQNGHVAAELTRRFLQRAGGVAQLGAAPAQPLLTDAMRMMLQAHGAVRLAVVIGQSGPPLTDLLPLENTQAAILHVAQDFPALAPRTLPLPTGGTLFQVSFEPASLVAFLRQACLSIDLLALLGAPGTWWDALRPCLAERAILVATAGIPFPQDGWPALEAPIQLAGVSVCHAGGWYLPVSYRPVQPGPIAEVPIPSLCVAAIVRNEQDAVVNMLASAAPIAGSFVVLDTGSTDHTFAQTETFLSESGTSHVLARAEPGRFDAMRNAALDLVPAGAEWVLMLDADEELCREDRDALRTLLPNAERDAYALPRYNYQGIDKAGVVAPYPDRQVRLLRCSDGRRPRYEGAVHETVRDVPVGLLPLDAGALGETPIYDRGGPHIHHLVRRYRSPVEEACKQEYYREIALGRLEGKAGWTAPVSPDPTSINKNHSGPDGGSSPGRGR